MIPISYNIRSLTTRSSSTLAAGFGIALVVFVFAAVSMLSAGIRDTLKSAGSDANAIIMRKSSQVELQSVVEGETLSLLRAAPEAAQGPNGAMVTGEVVVLIALPRIGGAPGAISNVGVRGTDAMSMELRPRVKLSEGRMFKPGTDEVIVGKSLIGKVEGLGLGKTVKLKATRSVTVVGVFSADGTSLESEMWADVDSLRSMFGRENSFSSITLRMKDKAAFDALQNRMAADPRLGLEAKREDVYYDEQSQGLATFISVLGTVIAVFFSIGAMIGAMITMYAQVAERGKEIGTLRALGFRRRKILLSFLLESVFLSLAGGVVGIIGAMFMGFVEFSTVNFATFSEVVFRFKPTPDVLVSSLIFAMVMGLLGGFLPALRAAKVSPVQAMRGA